MRKFRLLVIPFLLVFFSADIRAEEKNTGDRSVITMGIIGMFGTNTVSENATDVGVDPGHIIGAGLLLEKSLNRYFSAGTGIQYRYFENDFTMVDEISLLEFDATWKLHAISLPFHIITEFRGPKSSLSVYAGITYTHIFSSEMYTDDTVTSGMKKDDAMRFTNPSQVAASGGMRFQFRVTEYTDFFIGIMAEYYFTELLKNTHSGDDLHLLNYSFNTGYLFRTGLFN